MENKRARLHDALDIVRDAYELLEWLIAQTHYGGTHGGLSERECREIHDKIVTEMGFGEDLIAKRQVECQSCHKTVEHGYMLGGRGPLCSECCERPLKDIRARYPLRG